MHKKTLKFCLLIFLFVSSLLHIANSYGETVLVAVAANFVATARQLKPVFERDTGHTLVFSVASTGKLYNQIANGAPFDVLLAADTERPTKLVETGLAVAGSRFTYAIGKLALCGTDIELVDEGRGLRVHDGFNKLAIANPDTAPYGKAAVEAIKALGVYPQIKSRLVFGDSVAQAFQFVYTRNADLGIVALSQVIANPTILSWQLPEVLYKPIEQAAVLLTPGEMNVAAQSFMLFLKSTQALEMIKSNGYGVK